MKHDDANALKWFEKAAKQNHVIALRIAGNMYKTGSGTGTDYKKACEYYTKAIELGGDSWAQAALGNMYERGLYVKKNIKKAFELYKASAEQGNVRGQCNLGYMYANGYGVKKNLKVAREWLEKAANNESNGDGARDDAKKALKQLKGK